EISSCEGGHEASPPEDVPTQPPVLTKMVVEPKPHGESPNEDQR
ncbi:hypothetical protein L195_g063612, partial [Trifolium pratense]